MGAGVIVAFTIRKGWEGQPFVAFLFMMEGMGLTILIILLSLLLSVVYIAYGMKNAGIFHC